VLKPNVIRVLVLLLSVLAVAIATLPLVILVDLTSGGTGLGVCPDGIESCPRPFTAGAELAIILVIALGIVVAAIRVLMKLARAQQRRKQPLAAIESDSSLPDDQ